MSKKKIPTFDELMDPSIQALKRLGGSASIDELVTEIVQLLDLSQEWPMRRTERPEKQNWSIDRPGLGHIFAKRG